MKIKIAGIQMNVKDTSSERDKEVNIAKAIELIRKVDSADLIVFPELTTTGYTTKEIVEELAEDKEGKTISRFCEIAKEKNSHIVFGFAERKEGKIKNSLAIISNKGEVVNIYRKLHLCNFGDFWEKDLFETGDERVSFEINGVKVGVIICYDVRFPELARKLALEDGIDLLVHPVGFAKDGSFPSWHHFVITRALENQVYALSVNRAGEHFGNSIFCPPWIDWKVKPTILGEGEEILEKEIDTEIIKKVREEYQFRKDRLDKY